MYQLYQEQMLQASKEKLWKFISRPENLNEITPPEIEFTIARDMPEKMYPGLLIQYKVTLPLLGTSEWVTEIKHIEPGRQFVDEQRIGPYSFWYHYHALEEIPEGVKMIDQVNYKPPLGFLGALANKMMIRPKLDDIFRFRKKILDKRFT